ncbi:MAG: hypothetical protein ACJAXY_001548 [Nonlabens sp.]|jgi:hypothetical protein
MYKHDLIVPEKQAKIHNTLPTYFLKHRLKMKL